MKIRKFILSATIAMSMTSLLVACSKDSNSDTGSGGTSDSDGQYFIAATTGSADYLLSSSSLDTGTLTTAGRGVELLRAYTWIMHGEDKALGLIYQQGNPAPGIVYGLNSNGQITQSGNEFEVANGYTTYGPFQTYIVTSATGRSATYGDSMAVFNFYDVLNSNAVSIKTTKAFNYAGTGQKAVFSGILDMGDGTFMTGVVLSDQSTTSTSGIGTIINHDSCYAARLDANLNLVAFYRDGRLSWSAGRYRSAVYSQTVKDDNDNVYVFSGSYDSETTKKAGVIRINKGASGFDQSFYMDIQSAANNHKFKRVWHISDGYFLLEFYNQAGNITNTLQGSTAYGIVNTTAQTFNWLTTSTGMPDSSQITATGQPLARNGKMYMPITAVNQQPAVYVIDPAKNTATRGMVVNADAISAVGFLKKS